jgi:hypothetical protein
MKAVAKQADAIRQNRRPAANDNPFIKAQETISDGIVGMLDKWRDTQEALSEALFLSIYGSPALQAMVGIDPRADPTPKLEMSAEHRRLLEARIAELRAKMETGGLRESWIRALLYVGMTRGMCDERSLEELRRLRKDDAASRLTLAEFKSLVREQFFMLLLDQNASLAAIPKMLPEDMDRRRAAVAAIRDVLSAAGKISGDTAMRFNRITQLFGVADAQLPAERSAVQEAKAS